MSQATNPGELGDSWVRVMRSCCPNLTHSDWQLRHGGLVITTRFESHASRGNGARPHTLEVTVGAPVVDAYLRASMMQRYYATGRLVQFVLLAQLGGSPRSTSHDARRHGTEQRSVTYADLGLPPESSRPSQSGTGSEP
ncbi:MAG TPA: hypothetical protein VMH32_05110 [Burkholderiales bacterium]|nr:hypothetical protein [Burkholderiales bacterium]